MNTATMNTATKKPIIVSIEGSIGVGKSTLIDLLKNEYEKANITNIVLLKEPVELWEKMVDENGENILVNFYKNPRKYSFPFQVYIYTTILRLIDDTMNENPDCDMIICERSLGSSKNVFAKMLYDDGVFEPILYKIYDEMFSNHISDYMIYLYANPEICFERKNGRNRSGEDLVSLDYLKKCSEYHEKWIMDDVLEYVDTCRVEKTCEQLFKFSSGGAVQKSVLRVNIDGDYTDDILKEINNFILVAFLLDQIKS
jgi:deoxyadenosine/deoxycytidine kinase